MQGIINTMIQVFHSIKAEGSYVILLIAAMYILYRVNSNKNQWYIYYVLLTAVLVVANPVTVWILSKAFPVLGSYHTFLLLMPVLFVVPFAVTEFVEKAKDEKQGVAWCLIIVVIIALSGNLFGFYQREGAVLVCSREQKQLLQQLEEEQAENPILLVADESILPFVRTEAPSISMLYGRDLYQPGMDLGIVDGYSEEMLSFYEAMKNPEDTIEDILATADLYGCNAVIVRQFEDAPNELGHFKRTICTDHYIVYTIS